MENIMVYSFNTICIQITSLTKTADEPLKMTEP